MAQKVKRDYITYKDLDKIIDKYEPQYIMLISGRNDGKSYAVKERALRRYLSDKEQFTYLRRFEIDHKRSDPALYWADFFKKDSNKVSELTDGLWDRISAEGKQYFYLARKEGKNIVKGDAIGYIHALSVQSSYKSLQFPDVTNIIFEEMVSDRFLYNEPRILMNYVSTVLRSDIGRVWMIGNTITRINPYFREFQLTGFSKMQPGQVDVYDHTYTNDDGTESIHLFLYLIGKAEQEGYLGGESLVGSSQLLGAADVVEGIEQVGGSVLVLFACLLLPFLLVAHLLSVLVGFAFQEAQSPLVPVHLFLHHSQLLIDAVDAFEEVVAFEHARVFGHDCFLLAEFEEPLLLALQNHAGFVVATNPLLLCMQAAEALLQPLELCFSQSLGVLHPLQLRRVQYAAVASGRCFPRILLVACAFRRCSLGRPAALFLVFFAEEYHLTFTI